MKILMSIERQRKAGKLWSEDSCPPLHSALVAFEPSLLSRSFCRSNPEALSSKLQVHR